MLYTLSQAHYAPELLEALLAHLSPNDALLFWQDGVLHAVHHTARYANLPNVFVLENDLQARGLSTALPTLSLDAFISLTERCYPQIAL